MVNDKENELILDRDLPGPSKKAKRLIIIALLSVLVLGISVVVGMYYTSQPNFCSSCHQINPSVASWSVGPHKDVTCLKCHADPGTVGYVKRKVAGLNEVYLQVTNQVPDTIEAKVNPAACLACHSGSSEFPKAKNLLLTSGERAPLFPHTEMLQNNTSCLTCHQTVGHNTTTQPPVPVADAKTLTAVKTTAAPTLDGKSSEAFWASAPEMKLTLSNGGALQGGTGGKFDNGKTEVSMKATYDAENLYMLLQYKDPTDSKARGPWILEGGKLVKKPYTEFYEDKFAINWNINNSTKDFSDAGCTVTCHAATDKDGKAVTKHWTNAENELLDMWHWKYVRQNSLFGPDKPGLMHDQFMDNVKYDPNDATKSGAGRHADPGEKEYVDNVTDDKSAPKLVFDGAALNGNPYVIVDGLDKTESFTADYIKTMKEGDFIPGPIAKQITGDPADIMAKGKWENGVWTIEISRKLKTTSAKDVQFDDLAKTYSFAVAAFDNSQIGHAYENLVHKLAFKQ